MNNITVVLRTRITGLPNARIRSIHMQTHHEQKLKSDGLGIIRDKFEKEYKVDTLQNYPNLIEDVSFVVSDAFASEQSNDPLSKYVPNMTEYRDEYGFYVEKLLKKMKMHDKLHLSTIAINDKSEVVSAIICNDIYDTDTHLTEEEFPRLLYPNMKITMTFDDFISKNGIQRFFDKNENARQSKGTKNIFLHSYLVATKTDYFGRGIISSMFPLMINNGRENQFDYLFQMSTNPFTYHMFNKYCPDAQTYFDIKFRDYFGFEPIMATHDKTLFQAANIN